jgi:hypothetical protein
MYVSAVLKKNDLTSELSLRFGKEMRKEGVGYGVTYLLHGAESSRR